MSAIFTVISTVLIAIVSLILPFTSTCSTQLVPPPGPPVYEAYEDALVQELKIMSFNIYGPGTGDKKPENRMNGIVSTILEEMPDSVGLQEATDYFRYKLKRELCDSYAMACDYGRHQGLGEGVPILYRKDKYECLDSGVFWLSEKPCVLSMSWGTSLPRIAAWALLRDKETGFSYVHYNAHFDHQSEAARVNSAALLANRINARNAPAVLTGDFNCEPDSQAYDYLMQAELRDTAALAGEADSGCSYHGYSGETQGVPIDFIMANHYLRGVAGYQILRDSYDGLFPSDHFAVMATLTLANP
ncbi:MAG: endonuclease/exonuclease/phosphatase family protein [Oscillospiraceae bacterium]|nr:endonuclease/exonuclease/phosphatase family protein [Oscillospiraceae bacterium]